MGSPWSLGSGTDSVQTIWYEIKERLVPTEEKGNDVTIKRGYDVEQTKTSAIYHHT